jgi:hypothetical protein
VALSPVADFTFSGDSVRRNDGIDDMFSADLMDALVPAYLPQPELRTHPHVSPVFGDYAGVPPLLLVVGSTELLLDASVRVAQRCPGAQLLVWHAMPHVFAGFDFLPEAREATRRIGRFMRECLGDEAEPPVAAAGRPASAAPRVPRRLGVEAWVYLALALAAGSMWLAVLALWLAPALVLANPVVWAASAVVLVFVAVEAASVGRRQLAGCIAATLLLGPGCGLALFLFHRTGRRADNGA